MQWGSTREGLDGREGRGWAFASSLDAALLQQGKPALRCRFVGGGAHRQQPVTHRYRVSKIVEARKAKALNRQTFTNSCSDERKDRRQTTLRRGRKASASLKASTAVNKNRR